MNRARSQKPANSPGFIQRMGSIMNRAVASVSFRARIASANFWRDQYNPLRGLTIMRAVQLLEAGERGAYADLQWTYRFMEMQDATLGALIERRTSAIQKLDWSIKQRDKLPPGKEKVAAKQEAALRAAYEGIGNLSQALEKLAMASFRGFAHLEMVEDADGNVWGSQTAGASTSGLPKRQLVTISGPENAADALPQDFTDSVVVQSRAFTFPNALGRYDERLRAAGGAPTGVAPASFNMIGGVTYIVPGVDTRVTDADGNALPAGYNWYLTKGEFQDWFATNIPPIPCVQARVTATLYSVLRSIDPPPAEWNPADPVWFQATSGTKFSGRELAPGGGSIWITIWSATISATVPVVKTVWAEDTTLIRTEDYAFVNPPPDLATNLLATQNWLPYVGSVDMILEEPPAAHFVGKALNVANSLPEYASIKGLITGHRIVLETGQHTLTIGPPDRMAYRDLANRFRQSGASNTEWLTAQPVG